ncbi:MAG TPA: hypothetical protein VL092_11205 [Chitinophagaceae bacterium]|nr:hypothetical protein [Chitinophagaceae bacterium]
MNLKKIKLVVDSEYGFNDALATFSKHTPNLIKVLNYEQDVEVGAVEIELPEEEMIHLFEIGWIMGIHAGLDQTGSL